MERCDDYLMENDWAEGFFCTLPFGHTGPHRDLSDEQNVSTSTTGQKYRWVYEWEYI